MNRLRALFMAMGATVVLIEAYAHDFFPTEWNMALLIIAAACVGGVGVIAYATRNEVTK